MTNLVAFVLDYMVSIAILPIVLYVIIKIRP
jgi:hypothetical protein